MRSRFVLVQGELGKKRSTREEGLTAFSKSRANDRAQSIGRSGPFGAISVVDYRQEHFNRLPTPRNDLPVIISIRDRLLDRHAFGFGSDAGRA